MRGVATAPLRTVVRYTYVRSKEVMYLVAFGDAFDDYDYLWQAGGNPRLKAATQNRDR